MTFLISTYRWVVENSLLVPARTLIVALSLMEPLAFSGFQALTDTVAISREANMNGGEENLKPISPDASGTASSYLGVKPKLCSPLCAGAQASERSCIISNLLTIYVSCARVVSQNYIR